jgi:Zn-dependent protease with chaperone function
MNNQPYGVQQPQWPVVTLSDWMVTMLICVIPIVNVVMLFVWAFGAGTNPSKANWAKAALIWMAIGILLWVVVFGAIVSAILSSVS